MWIVDLWLQIFPWVGSAIGFWGLLKVLDVI
jgi:hypothetical protein